MLCLSSGYNQILCVRSAAQSERTGAGRSHLRCSHRCSASSAPIGLQIAAVLVAANVSQPSHETPTGRNPGKVSHFKLNNTLRTRVPEIRLREDAAVTHCGLLFQAPALVTKGLGVTFPAIVSYFLTVIQIRGSLNLLRARTGELWLTRREAQTDQSRRTLPDAQRLTPGFALGDC